MPQDVIDWVHVLARRQLSDHGLLFTNCLGDILSKSPDDDSDDSSYQPSLSTDEPSADQRSDSDDSSSYHPHSDDSLSSQPSDLGDQTDGDSNISSITEPPGLDLDESAIKAVDEHQEEDDDGEEDKITGADDDEEGGNAGVDDTDLGEITGVQEDEGVEEDDEGVEEDDEGVEEDENAGMEDMEAEMNAQYGP
jgi:hypothetical protein